MDKLKIWNAHPAWQEAEQAWDTQSQQFAATHPLRTLKHLPAMPGITPSTARFLKWKSLVYLLKHDKTRVIPRYYFKRPLRYTLSLLKSLFKKKSYVRDEDFFLYGIPSIDVFKEKLKNPGSVLVVGFSYCHKPFECPAGRFTDGCIHDSEHPVCGQCFIGKSVHALPEARTIPLFIPTVHYIGEKIFETIDNHPSQEVLFLITACEMTLEMFGDWGNMAGIEGIGVRLDGRICNTMEAFELSEKGIKPGLTVVLDDTQKRMLELIKFWRHCS